MRVGDGVDNGHRPGEGEFQLSRRMGARQPRFARMHPRAQPQFTDDRRAHRLVAVIADAHLDATFEIDAVDRLEESVDEMLARLLAVADDVDAGIFLQFEGEQCGVVLAGGKFIALQAPGRPEFVWDGEPRRFRQTAGNGGRNKRRDAACCHGGPGERSA